MSVTVTGTNPADPVAIAALIRHLRARIEDLEHELRLARQHLDGCERCQAVEAEDVSKRLADL